MKIKIGSKKIEIPDVKKVSEWGKIRGLMFRRRKNCPALLFEFSKPTRLKIHSCFVFFPFIALWLDDKNKIIEKKIVMPWRISVSPKEKYSKLLEIPLDKKYEKMFFPSDKRFK